MITVDHIYSGAGQTLEVGRFDEKTLPYLSVVQSVAGRYEIALGSGPAFFTEEGGFFVAPANVMQHITHHPPKGGAHMKMRWIFMDIKIDGVWQLNDWAVLPVVLPPGEAAVNALFNELFSMGSAPCRKDLLTQVRQNAACLELAKHILARSTPLSPPGHEKILPALALLNRPFEKTPTAAELAKSCSLSVSHFLKLFTACCHMPPGKYARQQKLRQGAVLLLQTDKSVAEISDSLGFYDQFHFCREFKKAFGQPPLQYKKQAGKY